MVKIMTRIYPLLAFITLCKRCLCSRQFIFTRSKINSWQCVRTWNVGAGLTQKITHLQSGMGKSLWHCLCKSWAFLSMMIYPAGGQVGFRYPVHFTGKDKNGYYLGVYAGHIDSKK